MRARPRCGREAWGREGGEEGADTVHTWFQRMKPGRDGSDFSRFLTTFHAYRVGNPLDRKLASGDPSLLREAPAVFSARIHTSPHRCTPHSPARRHCSHAETPYDMQHALPHYGMEQSNKQRHPPK
eukprot:6299948-Prymnesium_polylepis.1